MTDMSTSTTRTDQDDDLGLLYAEAFREFGTMALWNIRQFESPTPELALMVAHHLRIEGDMRARQLAERIEKAARAGHQATS